MSELWEDEGFDTGGAAPADRTMTTGTRRTRASSLGVGDGLDDSDELEDGEPGRGRRVVEFQELLPRAADGSKLRPRARLSRSCGADRRAPCDALQAPGYSQGQRLLVVMERRAPRRARAHRERRVGCRGRARTVARERTRPRARLHDARTTTTSATGRRTSSSRARRSSGRFRSGTWTPAPRSCYPAAAIDEGLAAGLTGVPKELGASSELRSASRTT